MLSTRLRSDGFNLTVIVVCVLVSLNIQLYFGFPLCLLKLECLLKCVYTLPICVLTAVAFNIIYASI